MQSQTHTSISFRRSLRTHHWLMALCLVLSCVSLGTVHAQGKSTGVSAEQASNYNPVAGDPFFVLTDTSYSSAEQAKVRLEVPAGSQAVRDYGGVDIVVYRITDPLEFLKQQKNLHRVQTDGHYVGEGLSNTLAYLWDSWFKRARLAWQSLFAGEARVAVTAAAPELKSTQALKKPTEFRPQPQYALLKEQNGFKLLDQFRYPVFEAQPIEPLKGVKLAGSSSEFMPRVEGNVYVPVGKLAPGLYLVEAFVGTHRANTLLFVSDTVGVTKMSANQMLLWAANRLNSKAVSDVEVIWTDGRGVLQSGKTNASGLAIFERESPERTYVMGKDPSGGVFISENFYYDSEIYNAKIYAVTDRPLYRPGDEVNVKFIGRQFISSRESSALGAEQMNMTVFDPNGAPVMVQPLPYRADGGGDARFKLPANSVAGGYEIRFTYGDGLYSSAFRVADYVKPHFEINLVPDKADFKTGEPVKGKLQLNYPDGKPVKNAQVQLTLRSQQLTMVEGELQYTGLFPLKLQTTELTTGADGTVAFELPAATEPSRYMLTAFASDGAAYRVRATRELLIERSAAVFTVRAAKQFSTVGERVALNYAQQQMTGTSVQERKPTKVEWVRLEDRTKGEVPVAATATGAVELQLPAAGSYSITLRDERGAILGGTSHWVAGDGLKVAPGSIEIVTDKERYNAGETAQLLITFSEPVETALLTLERDKVEQTALSTSGAPWVKVERVSPMQLRASVPVTQDFSPNITFSVAYAKGADFVFQNQGLVVAQPAVAITYKADKEVYAPGETVTLDLLTMIGNKPVASNVTLGVVDEMIYVLQPEIAPNILDFFYHPRRNNVRTSSSLAFISYDMSSGRLAGPPKRSSTPQRGVKVLERPRRDEVDTAYWNGNLRTDANGRARITFRMPDSLTRWRITGRAITDTGTVGQRMTYVRSEKPFYVKWTSPNWLREGDAPVATFAAFNQTAQEQTVQYAVTGGGNNKTDSVKLKPGINLFSIPLSLDSASAALNLKLTQGNAVVDSLDQTITRVPKEWKSERSVFVPLNLGQTSTPLALPADASNISVSLAQGASSHFARIADDLVEYPYGCVEQTSSRLIPLALGAQSIAETVGDRGLAATRINQMLQQNRLRLVYMAGPNATFGWWGNQVGTDLLMTSYAYYADWLAARALGLPMDPAHWDKLIPIFDPSKAKAKGKKNRNNPEDVQNTVLASSLSQQTLALWFASEMGLPTKTMIGGVLNDLAKAAPNLPTALPNEALGSSPVLANPDGPTANAMTIVLANVLAQGAQLPVPPELASRYEAAVQLITNSNVPSARALSLLARRNQPLDRAAEADKLLASVAREHATFDRSLTLIWTQKALGITPGGKVEAALAKPWQTVTTSAGLPLHRLTVGSKTPVAIDLTAPLTKATTAVVKFESTAREPNSLNDVTVERKLYRVVPTNKAMEFELQLMSAGDSLRTDELYVDEVVLTPTSQSRNHLTYGLLEAPLPPGASVESTTWGLRIRNGKAPASAVKGEDATTGFERARHEPTREGYGVPVDFMQETQVVRHLVRFSQKGKFTVPAARYYSMYQPSKKALEGGGTPSRAYRVE